MYRPVSWSNFGGGLNLRDQPDVVAVGQAVDCLNVEFTERGAIKQRGGYMALSDTPGNERYTSLVPFYTTGGVKQLLAAATTRVDTLDTTGAIVGSVNNLSQGPYGFARIGTPNAERVYFGNGTDTTRIWDGASFSEPSATVDGVPGCSMPRAGLLAVEGNENRLVASGFSTSTGGPNAGDSSPSHVYFSDPGDPESWQPNNYVQLRPGDGERIQAVVAWRDYIIVFKESAFFVFYGESIDTEGNPIFQYRTVEAGIGVASSRAVVAAREGVYFMSRNGVYLTTGAEPQLVSAAIGPMWNGSKGAFFKSSAINQAAIRNANMAWHRERLYLSVPTGTASNCNRILVFDPTYGYWTLFDIPASTMTTFRASSSEQLAFGYSTGETKIGLHDEGYTNDDGQAIVSRWTSGWSDFSNPANIKTVRETKLWGDGKLNATLLRDYELDFIGVPVDFTEGQDLWTSSDLWGDGTGTDLWGPKGALTPKLVRQARRGTMFATRFENAELDQAWSIHRLSHHLREVRPPTTVSVDGNTTGNG